MQFGSCHIVFIQTVDCIFERVVFAHNSRVAECFRDNCRDGVPVCVSVTGKMSWGHMVGRLT